MRGATIGRLSAGCVLLGGCTYVTVNSGPAGDAGVQSVDPPADDAGSSTPVRAAADPDAGMTAADPTDLDAGAATGDGASYSFQIQPPVSAYTCQQQGGPTVVCNVPYQLIAARDIGRTCAGDSLLAATADGGECWQNPAPPVQPQGTPEIIALVNDSGVFTQFICEEAVDVDLADAMFQANEHYVAYDAGPCPTGTGCIVIYSSGAVFSSGPDDWSQQTPVGMCP